MDFASSIGHRIETVFLNRVPMYQMLKVISSALVRADETQIHQVVLNLVLNAVDAMGGEGTVTVETGRLHDGETALVTVEDTGSGEDAGNDGGRDTRIPFAPGYDSG